MSGDIRGSGHPLYIYLSKHMCVSHHVISGVWGIPFGALMGYVLGCILGPFCGVGGGLGVLL